MSSADTIAPFYLGSLLAPLSPWLRRDDVTDIYINRPQEVWIETLGGTIETHPCAALDESGLARLARQLAALSAQAISREHPLLAANLPDGSRVQVVAPPASRSGHVIAIRRHVASGLTLSALVQQGTFADLAGGDYSLERSTRLRAVESSEVEDTLRAAVRSRRNILISGGTSTGKTTVLNALLREIAHDERLLLIEDTPELAATHANQVSLVAARSSLGEAIVDTDDLLMAALRMRPDRIILGELRGREAFTFLRAVNTGHPGSMTTIHADSPSRAIEQLVLLVLQTGSQLSRDGVRHYVQQSIDVFVQLERTAGSRRVSHLVVRS